MHRAPRASGVRRKEIGAPMKTAREDLARRLMRAHHFGGFIDWLLPESISSSTCVMVLPCASPTVIRNRSWFLPGSASSVARISNVYPDLPFQVPTPVAFTVLTLTLPPAS